MPVLSTTTSTPSSFQGSSAGLRTARARIFLPSTIRFSASCSTLPWKRRCVLSYLSSVASILLSVRSLIATTSNSCGRECNSAERQPADPTESVDGNTNGHLFFSYSTARRIVLLRRLLRGRSARQARRIMRGANGICQPNRQLYRSRGVLTTGPRIGGENASVEGAKSPPSQLESKMNGRAGQLSRPTIERRIRSHQCRKPPLPSRCGGT